jgi:hypothetical protein
MIKPIETFYNGHRFRSRLEARWAVFFDVLGTKYEYEKEGFELPDAGRYLPDFWLPQQKAWMEIKGQETDEYDEKRFCSLAYHSSYPVFVFVGEIRPDILANFAHPVHPPSKMAFLVPCMTWYECNVCRTIIIDADNAQECHLCGGRIRRDTTRLLAAYCVARQARFENNGSLLPV